MGLAAGSPALLYNPFDAGLADDPYPVYRRLRETDPVHHSPLGFWVLSRYRDVVWAQQEARFGAFSERVRSILRRAGEPTGAEGPVTAVARRWSLLAEPASHRRFRSVMGRCFTPRALWGLRAHVARTVDELLSALERGPRTADLVEAFARPLPTNLAAALLGLPHEDRERCRRWSLAIGRIDEVGLSPDRMRAFRDAVVECETHLRGLLERREPGADDVLAPVLPHPGPLPAGGGPSGDVDLEELTRQLTLVLFGAAYATTASFLGTSVLALLHHPDQLDLLRREPALAEGAVEELLRYDAPSQYHSRWTLADVEVDGQVIPAGSRVILLMGAANRDPEQFPDPDRLDLARAGVRPASFGGGPHFCLGAGLARLEARVALRGLVERFPRLGPVVAPPRWRPDAPGLRSLDSLVVSLDGGRT